MTDREFAETFMKSLYSKHTDKLLFSIYPISQAEIDTLEPLVGYPDFEFTDRQRKVYGALQRKYGLHYWKPRERPLRPVMYYKESEYIDPDAIKNLYAEMYNLRTEIKIYYSKGKSPNIKDFI
jgi:hypothetical protein